MAAISPEIYEQLRQALARSTAVVAAKKAPDEKDQEETHAAREAAAKVASIEEDVQDKRHFRALREKYAKWVFTYLVCYSVGCLVLLLATGFKFWGFILPESVLGFLVGSTAVSAIGLVLAVTHGLFKR